MKKITTKAFGLGSVVIIAVAFATAVLAGDEQGPASQLHDTMRATDSLLSQLRPGERVKIISELSTVISTQHYQEMIGLTCSNSCTGAFSKPGAKHQTNVTRISCYILAGNGSTFTSGYAALINSRGQLILNQFLPIDFSSSIGDHLLNHAVDFQVRGAQHIEVNFHVSSSYAGFCTATGTLDTLQ